MSINSKAKRDAKKKRQKSKPLGVEPKLVEHAHLRDGSGAVFGGAALRGEEWVMVLGGDIVAGTDSAAMILAMLKHVAASKEESGEAVRLDYSTQLRDAATREAEAEGKTLYQYLEMLEQERAERHEDAAPGGVEEGRSLGQPSGSSEYR